MNRREFFAANAALAVCGVPEAKPLWETKVIGYQYPEQFGGFDDLMTVKHGDMVAAGQLLAMCLPAIADYRSHCGIRQLISSD